MSAHDGLMEFSAEVADGNWAALSDFLADDFFSYAPGPDEPTAAERFLSVVTDLQGAMSNLSASFADVATDGNGYTAHLTVTGTHDGPLWGAPATGRHIVWTNPITVKPIGDRFAVRFDDIGFPDVVVVLREFGLINPPDEMDQPPPHPVSLPDFLVKVVLTGQAADKECVHLDQVQVIDPPTRMCAQCFAEGTNWPALRLCLICGFVGCCDTSKNKHMLKHFEETGHPIMRSIRMDEGWVWCYEDNAYFETSILERYR